MQSGEAIALDAADPLKSFRDEFRLPLFGAVGAILVDKEQRAWVLSAIETT